MSALRRISHLLVAMVLVASASDALVRYDEGRMSLLGVTLLQDYADSTKYYYLPQSPRLATKSDGSYDLLCLKYVDRVGGASGGLFHALVEFSLPPTLLEKLEAELGKRVPGATIAGVVPMTQALDDGADGLGSFRVVSAVLTDEESGGFSRSLITSGRAPLLPGSKAVVASLLNERGATLLWDSLGGATSDVSVAVHSYYEAAVESYNARVSAEMTTVYEHFSQVVNQQQGYSKRQIRDVVDELRRDGTLEVEVLDRTESLGVDASHMDGILQLVTDKLTDLMFDHTAGWAVDPDREAGVEDGQLRGRQDRSWLARAFGNRDDTPYYTDDQYVIKNREDIRANRFSLVLSHNTTVKVPVDTAGNLSGFYGEMKNDARYFRVVDLDDPAFEFRTIHFQVDGDYVDSFRDTINFASVSIRKKYGGRPVLSRTLFFSSEEIAEGRTTGEVSFPRLGDTDSSWTEFEYQVRWSLRDLPTLAVPAAEDEWIRSSDPAISLIPPFERREIEIEADRQLLAEADVSGLLEVATVLAGQPRIEKKALLRPGDSEAVTAVAIYYDRDTAVGYRLSWNDSEGTRVGALLPLETDHLFVLPTPSDGSGGGNP